jgi:hypothetical protein
MSVAKYEITDQEALAWCKKLEAEGIELKMTWDGGGDSGWVDFEIDKDETTDEDNLFIEYLRSKCYDELDYGSWAGEFTANGEAVFDPKENAFIGTDYYAEDSNTTLDCNIRIAVSKDVWFDRLELSIQNHDITVDSDLVVINGFKSTGHAEAMSHLNQSISDQIYDLISNLDNYRTMWTELSIPYSEFTAEKDEMVHYLTSLVVGTEDEEEKGIYIDLNTEA